jgi:hypothetical protein
MRWDGRGLLTGEFPYHFLDMATLGAARTGLSITTLPLAFLLIGTALVALDHWLGKPPSRVPAGLRN